MLLIEVPKKLSQDLARKIYDEHYCKRYNIDKIKNKTIAAHVLDSTINPSPGYTGRWLQEEINKHLKTDMKVDGILGSKTRAALEKAEKIGALNEINNGLAKKRIKYYKNIAEKNPKKRGFLKGWIKRAESYILPPIPKKKPL